MPEVSSTARSAAQAQRLVGRPAARELVPTVPGTSARWHMHDYPGPYCRWNYHPEYEVHLIQRGTGRYIMGDHIGRFTAGHLALVGSNLPTTGSATWPPVSNWSIETWSSSSTRSGSRTASSCCRS